MMNSTNICHNLYRDVDTGV